MKSRFFLQVPVQAAFFLGMLSFKASGNPGGAMTGVLVSCPGSPGAPTAAAPAVSTPVAKLGSSSRSPTKPADEESGEIDLPLELTPLVREARDQSARGNFPEAEKIYRQILEKAPNNLYVLSSLGVVLFYETKYNLAEETLKKAIALGRNDSHSHSTLGYVYYAEDKYDAAIDELDKAIALNPRNGMAHNYLGISLGEKGWNHLAQTEFEMAISLDSRDADAHFNLAVVLATKAPPDKEGAGKYYQQALELGAGRDEALEQLLKTDAAELGSSSPSPTKPADGAFSKVESLPPGLKSLATLASEATSQFERGNYPEAEKIFRRMLEAAPNNLYALTNLGVVLFRENKMHLAEETFKQALKVAPEDGFSHCTLGIVYYQESKLDDAVYELTKALAINPKNPTAHNYLGITASQKGWPEAARKELETAVSLDANYADAYFNLAVVLAMNNPPDKESAGKYYQRARELGSGRDEALEQLIK